MDTFRRHLADVLQYAHRGPQVDGVSTIKAEHYAEAFNSWRRQFCEEFTICMPLELRDMTYGYLVDFRECVVRYHPQDGKETDDHADSGRIEWIVSVIWPTWTMYETKRLCDSQEMGQEFADDISCFLFGRQSLDVLEPSRLPFALRFGIFPRGLRVHWWEHDASELNHGNVKAKLDSLLKNQVRGNSTIEFFLHMKDVGRCIKFLRFIAPAIFKLKDTGAEITIIRACGSIKCNSPYSCVAYPPFREYDLTWLFADSIENFNRKLLHNGQERRAIQNLGVQRAINWRLRDYFVRPRTEAPRVPE